MKLKTLFNSLSCLFIPGITATDNGVMITGDGSVIMEKLGKISTAEDMSIGLKHKNCRYLSRPVDFMKNIIDFKYLSTHYFIYMKHYLLLSIAATTFFFEANAQTVTMTSNTTLTTSSPDESTTSVPSDNDKRRLLASGPATVDFAPAPGMTAVEIETKVNAVNPYTLYRKGSVAEYCFQYKGKQTQWQDYGPTYLQQIVCDEKAENGLIVAYIKAACFNKKHEPSKGIAASFKEAVFPIEIDTAGTYHLTHNPINEYFLVKRRRGFGILVPGFMKPGMQLKSSTINDKVDHCIGLLVNMETVYSDWQVVGEEKKTTPAGTFDCVKLTGHIAQKYSKGKYHGEKITCWLARGIGIVQYEIIYDNDKKKIPFIAYLNKIDIK